MESHLCEYSGPRFNIKYNLPVYKNSDNKDTTASGLPHLNNGNPSTGTMIALYWIGQLGVMNHLTRELTTTIPRDFQHSLTITHHQYAMLILGLKMSGLNKLQGRHRRNITRFECPYETSTEGTYSNCLLHICYIRCFAMILQITPQWPSGLYMFGRFVLSTTPNKASRPLSMLKPPNENTHHWVGHSVDAWDDYNDRNMYDTCEMNKNYEFCDDMK